MLSPALVAHRVTLATVTLLLAVGCGGDAHRGKTPIGNRATPTAIALTEAGVAGVTMDTRADEPTVGALLAGTTVRRDDDNRDVLEVWRGEERLFYVVAVNADRAEAGVFNVHVTSPSVAGPNGWHVGGTVGKQAQFDTCECWGGELAVCYRKGTHVAVAFDQQECDAVAAVADVVDLPIVRMVWNPLPWPKIRPTGAFGPDGDEGRAGDPCGH